MQKLWKALYNLPDTFPVDGSQWDHLFADGETFRIGDLDARVMLSPGHTLASITYVTGVAAFIHDTLFMPDYGTAGADFPGGSASRLWRSIQQILALPDATRLFTGHDYLPGGREPRWESAVAQSEGGEQAPTAGEYRGVIRRDAAATRRQTADAEAHPTVAAGKYCRRPPAAAGKQWQTLSEAAARCVTGWSPGVRKQQENSASMGVMQ